MFSTDTAIKLLFITLLTSAITACGGGSGLVDTDIPITVENPEVIVDDPEVVIENPEVIVEDPKTTPLVYDIEIPVFDISASTYMDPSMPQNAIDKNFDNESRWSGQGTSDIWLQLDLGDLFTVNTLNITFLHADERDSCFNIQTSVDGVDWMTQRSNIVSNQETSFSFNETETRYIRYQALGNSEADSDWNSIIEIAVFLDTLDDSIDISDGESFESCSTAGSVTEPEEEVSADEQETEDGLIYGKGATFIAGNPDETKDPSENFDLSNWKITYPDASELDPPKVSQNEFYTDPETGAMVFECVNQGEVTSNSTKYSRTELREMVSTNRSEDTKSLGNNWVISTAPDSYITDAGAIDGNMKATVAVDHVSTTYSGEDEFMLGRIIVGQIHGSENEPFKIFYRKLPNNSKGSVYFSYEDADVEDYYELIGSRDNDASDPVDGISLGEKWAYEVDVKGRDMTVTVIRENGDYIKQTITWDDQYDEDWFYFKAGNYNQNNGGDESDYSQASFFHLDVMHD